MKTLIILVLLVVLGVGAYFFFADNRSGTAPDTMANGAQKVGRSISNSVGEIDVNEVKAELAHTGQVVRKKAGELRNQIADATADARATAAIKAKYTADPDLSAISISVNTTAGLTTLSGEVNSPELLARAIQIAVNTEGVTQVTSTLQLKK